MNRKSRLRSTKIKNTNPVVSEWLLRLKSYARLVENISALFVIQLLNYVLPFFIFPYLVRVLGVERFGAIAFASATAQYAALVMNYSFAITAPREVSTARNDIDRLSNCFWAVAYSKSILTALAGLMLFFMTAATPSLNKEFELVCAAFALVVAETFFPIWFFQGVEQMKVITIVHFIARLAYASGIVLLVNSQSDDVLCLMLQAASQAVGSIVGLFAVWQTKPLKRVRPSLQIIIATLKNGWSVFLSQIGVNLFNSANLTILGALSTNEQVGLYAIADKVVRAAIMLSAPLTSGLFPHISLLFGRSTSEALSFLRKIAMYGSLAFFGASAGLFVFADLIVVFITGGENQTISQLIRIISPLPLTVFLDNIFGTQILLNLRYEKEFMWSILAAGLISLALSLALVPQIAAVGTAISFLSAGLTVLTLVYCATRYRGIRFF